MKTYRMQVDATICFSVEAGCEPRAILAAQKLIDDALIVHGWEIDMGNSETEAVVYADDDFMNKIEITDIVGKEEGD